MRGRTLVRHKLTPVARKLGKASTDAESRHEVLQDTEGVLEAIRRDLLNPPGRRS